MDYSEVISHDGIVTGTDGEGVVEVAIKTGTACSACHARSACGMGSEETRSVRIKSQKKYSAGEKVTVTMEQSQGKRAVIIGYVIPLIVLIASFIIFSMAGIGELFTCLASFAALAACYLIIWLLRDRIEKRFTFKIND